MDREFKEIFKELRYEKGLTQAQLAERLNYTQGNISGWENGTVEPKATALISIANFFGITTDYLIGRTDDFGTPTAAPMSNDSNLTEKEKALLKAFKNLLPETQDFVLRTAQSLSDANGEKSLKKS